MTLRFSCGFHCSFFTNFFTAVPSLLCSATKYSPFGNCATSTTVFVFASGIFGVAALPSMVNICAVVLVVVALVAMVRMVVAGLGEKENGFSLILIMEDGPTVNVLATESILL